MNVELPIRLHDNQRVIFENKALNQVVMAGKRFGKSELAVFKTIKAAGENPGGVFWYIAPYFSHAESIAWQKFLEYIPQKLWKHKQDNKLTLTLVNDARIVLKGADNQTSLRGPKIDGAVFDEAAYMDQYIWNNIIRGQLLGVNGERPGFAFFISSPINPAQVVGKNFKDWYPDFYQTALNKSQSGNEDWAAFHYTIFDNQYLSLDQINDIKADSTDDQWAVEYMAKPSSFAGKIYSEFDYAKHVTEESSNKVSLFIRGIDWGIAHPTVCLFAQVDVQAQTIFIEDEYVKSDFTIEESADVIQKKTGGRTVDWTVCDPSLNKRNSQTKRTDKQEFDRLGIFCIPGDNNNRGYNITKMFLKKDMIKIHPRCRILIKQLRDLQWTDKTDDDCPDVLRYMCVRLHDLIWNGIFNKVKTVEKLKPTTFNLNDTYLFSKREGEGGSYKEQVAFH